jgi:hypothetical protein
MRFVENGPDIPREIRHSREQGNVVFFCGAGVSLSAGLPGFPELTDKMITALDPEPKSDIRKWFDHTHPHFPTPYADIYQAMQDEFGVEWVEHYLSEFLGAPPKSNTSNHGWILELSKNTANKPQVITTNIDPLFEKAWHENQKLEVHHPPRLPDGNFSGVVYLHGKRKNPKPATERKNYIFSTSDFGRAYLSDAWATDFIKDLLYTGKRIVFVGYSADDPPVKYLLQALHASDQHHSLYAFADYCEKEGSPEEVTQNWRNKGVTVMPYPSANERKDHSALWRSLQKWAWKKRTPLRWDQLMRRLSARSPSKLKPYIREQIVEWVGSFEGRLTFNESNPPPPAQWLEELPNCDLEHLTEWFSHILNDPFTARWTAQQKILPEKLLKSLQFNIQYGSRSLDKIAFNIWYLIVQAYAANTADAHSEWDRACRDLSDPESRPRHLNIIRICLIPRIKLGPSRPKRELSWDNPDTITKFTIEFPIHPSDFGQLRVDGEVLPYVFAIFRNALEQTALLLAQLPALSIWDMPDLPRNSKKSTRSPNEGIWSKTAELFDQLIKANPEKAKAETHIWPENEPFFFDKLRLYAWSKPELATGQCVAERLLSEKAPSFWEPNNRLQYIQLLSTRWNDFSPYNRELIEKSICSGNPSLRTTQDDVAEAYEQQTIHATLHELKEQECTLSPFAEHILAKQEMSSHAALIKDHNKRIFDSLSEKFNFTKPPPPLINTAFSTPLDTSSGLYIKPKWYKEDIEQAAKDIPMILLQVLQENEHPEYFIDGWKELAVSCPHKLESVQARALATAFLELPETCHISLAQFLPRWFKGQLPNHAKECRKEALKWWDEYFNFLTSQPGSLHAQEWVSNHDHLSQSPLFMLIECLMAFSSGPDLLLRYEKALAFEHPMQAQVVCALASQMVALFEQDALWTIQNLRRHFHNENCEAAWSGFLRDKGQFKKSSPALISHLKRPFLCASRSVSGWNWNGSSAAIFFAEFYATTAMFNFIPDNHARQFLRNVGDAGRNKVIEQLMDEEKFWPHLLKPLIEKAWPKDANCKTPEMSKTFANALIRTGCDFPGAVDTLLPFLGETEQLLFSFDTKEIIAQHPKAFLNLLDRVVADAVQNRPWKLRDLIDQIAVNDPKLKTDQKWTRLFYIAFANE